MITILIVLIVALIAGDLYLQSSSSFKRRVDTANPEWKTAPYEVSCAAQCPHCGVMFSWVDNKPKSLHITTPPPPTHCYKYGSAHMGSADKIDRAVL
jgi:hypothetical protein